MISHAGIERERTNLARYFSPNVVEQLSRNDEPLKQVRTQNVAVLFADIVDFTAYADGRSPMEVIGTLRQFHERMEREVFRHGGTLDKYLGDGLMATFGTPFAGDFDAVNALRCAQAMIGSIDELNLDRKNRSEPPIRLSIGLHYGEVVLGDIGLNRLEFAVIGTAVNAASRLETLTASTDAPWWRATILCGGRGTKPTVRTPTSRFSSKSRPRQFAASSNRSASGRGITSCSDAFVPRG